MTRNEIENNMIVNRLYFLIEKKNYNDWNKKT